VTGILAEVPVNRGDFVRTGDVVARLEFSVEEASVALGRAQASRPRRSTRRRRASRSGRRHPPV